MWLYNFSLKEIISIILLNNYKFCLRFIIVLSNFNHKNEITVYLCDYVPEREEFLFLFSAIFTGKTDPAEFFTQSYRDNPDLPTSTNCQTYAYIPKGLPGSVKSWLQSVLERGRLKGRTEGSQLPYLYLSQSPSPRASNFSFSPLVERSSSVCRRHRGRVRRDDVINYRVSKPRRAFICTALALSLAPFLIRAPVTSDALLRYVAKSWDNFDKFALTEKSINNSPFTFTFLN